MLRSNDVQYLFKGLQNSVSEIRIISKKEHTKDIVK
jgi:hypothetical protein